MTQSDEPAPEVTPWDSLSRFAFACAAAKMPMISQGQEIRRPDAADDHEYNASSGEAPIEFLVPLFALIFVYGVFLTAFVPFGCIMEGAIRLQRGEILQPLWLVALAGLTFFVLLRWCAIQTMAFIVHCKLIRDRSDLPTTWPLVSVLVPAFQESTTIVSALRSLIDLDYPNYEIIVVDDGSSDDTFARASAFVGRHDRCTLTALRKPNGGKWSALNLAFEHATADLVLCIDADSRISRDALKRMIMRVNQPGVAGVSGQITVRNRDRLISRFQAYEYVVTNGGLRTAQSLFGLVLVVPGPIGLYRRQALQSVFEQDMQVAHELRRNAARIPGPFSHETFAEDFQLSLTILSLGGRIVYESAAVSYTKSPDLTHALLNQRYRWYRGTMQVLRIYIRRLRHFPGSTKRRLDIIITAVFLLELFILPILTLIILFSMAIFIATSPRPGDILIWVAAIWLLNLMSATYHLLTQRDSLSLLSLVPFYDLYQGILLNSAWVIAMFDELRQSKMNW